MVEEKVTILALLKDQVSSPAKAINTTFKKTAAITSKISGSFGSLAKQVGALAAAYISLAGVRTSIALAERQIRAERSILAALGGQADELERIKELTSQIQRETLFGDEELNEQAALLLTLGGGVENLEKNIRAVVDTSTALNVSMENVTRSIARFRSNEGGRLTQQIPELKTLQEDGKLAAEGVDTLLKLFSGRAADEAQTTFGKIQQVMNDIGDQGEKVGIVFAELKLKALTAFLPIATAIADAFQSDEARKLLNIVGQLTPLIISTVAVLGALVGGILTVKFFGAIAVTAAAVTAVVGLLATIVPLLIKNFTTILSKFLRAFDLLDKTEGLLGKIVNFIRKDLGLDKLFDKLKSTFDLFADGTLQVEDLFDLVVLKFNQFSTLLEAFITNPIAQQFIAIGKFIVGTFNIVRELFAAVKGSLIVIFSFAEQKINETISFLFRRILSSFDKLKEFLGKFGLDLSDDVAFRLQRAIDSLDANSFEAEFNKNFEAKLVVESVKQLGVEAVKLSRIIPEAVEEVVGGISGGLKKVGELEDEYIEELKKKVLERVAAHKKIRNESDKEEKKRLDLRKLALLKSLEEEARVERDKINQVRQETAARLQAGLIFQSDAFEIERQALAAFQEEFNKINLAFEEFIAKNPELKVQAEEILARILEIRGSVENPETGTFFTGLEQGFTAIIDKFKTLRQVGFEVGNFLGNSFDGFIAAIGKGKQSLKEFVNQAIADLGKLILKMVIFSLISKAIGFLGGIGSVDPGGTGVDVPLIRNKGGWIPGTGPNRDSVTVAATPGEYYLQRPSAQHYGSGILEALNNRLIPRGILAPFARGTTISPSKLAFNTGGSVGSAPSESGPTPAFLVANDETLESLIAGGRKAFDRALRQSGSIINSVVKGR